MRRCGGFLILPCRIFCTGVEDPETFWQSRQLSRTPPSPRRMPNTSAETECGADTPSFKHFCHARLHAKPLFSLSRKEQSGVANTTRNKVNPSLRSGTRGSFTGRDLPPLSISHRAFAFSAASTTTIPVTNPSVITALDATSVEVMLLT